MSKDSSYVPGRVLRAFFFFLYKIAHLILSRPYRVATFIISVLERRRWRHRKVK